MLVQEWYAHLIIQHVYLNWIWIVSVERLSVLMEWSLRLECLLQVPLLSERWTIVKTHERLLVFCMITLCNCMLYLSSDVSNSQSVFCGGNGIMIRMLNIHTCILYWRSKWISCFSKNYRCMFYCLCLPLMRWC